MPAAPCRFRGELARVSVLLAHFQGLVLVCLTLWSCDRDDLSSGPRVTKRQVVSDPGPVDCPPIPLGSLKVKINEVMPRNSMTLEDEAGSFPAWIEIYNSSDVEVNLGGVPLTNELGKPEKWNIPCIASAIVPPRGFLVIFADGDATEDNDFHASFEIAVTGGLQLMINKGSDIFFFDASRLGVDESGGRFPDGAAAISVLSAPTPGAPNLEPKAPANPAQGMFVRGDSNGDGRVNISDLTAILKTLFQSESLPACQDRMDSNDDGAVNVSDVLYTGQALYQHGPTFPPPYPAAGTDPTADGLPCPHS